jgi:hypothetical protein
VFRSTAPRRPDNDPLAYLWAFGDGATGSGARPTPIRPLVRSPVLNVNDGRGGTDSKTARDDRVDNRPPKAVQVDRIAAPPAAIVFDGSASTDPDNDTLTYAWTFGDGGNAAGAKAHLHHRGRLHRRADGQRRSRRDSAQVAVHVAAANRSIARPGGPTPAPDQDL